MPASFVFIPFSIHVHVIAVHTGMMMDFLHMGCYPEGVYILLTVIGIM